MGKKTIILTGGSSSGHVTPNIALIEALKKENWNINYIGSYNGIEKDLMNRINIPFHGISSGKLRRYFSWKNFIDPFKILWGIGQSFWIIHRLKPQIVFSKGGFVAFPVVIAAWLRHIPIVVHESDFRPGLANKLSFPFAKYICVTFKETSQQIKYKEKIKVTGLPIRNQLFSGSKEKALKLCGFASKDRSCLFIFGGSQGAEIINQTIRSLLPTLTEKYQIIHLCGKGKLDPSLLHREDYCQFEYLHDELPDALALADVVISRSGANSLYELLSLKIPHILIPLSKKASRGDQIDNAKYFTEQGISNMILEEELNSERLLNELDKIEKNKQKIKEKLTLLDYQPATPKIINLLIQICELKSNSSKASI